MTKPKYKKIVMITPFIKKAVVVALFVSLPLFFMLLIGSSSQSCFNVTTGYAVNYSWEILYRNNTEEQGWILLENNRYPFQIYDDTLKLEGIRGYFYNVSVINKTWEACP